MKNTLLDDLTKIYETLECTPPPDYRFNRCSHCQNKLICETILNLIVSITDYYEEE